VMRELGEAGLGAGVMRELGEGGLGGAAGVPHGLEGSRVDGAVTGGDDGTAQSAWVAREVGGGTASGPLGAGVVLDGGSAHGGSAASTGGGIGIDSGVGGVLRGPEVAPTGVCPSASASILAVVRGGSGGDPRELTRAMLSQRRSALARISPEGAPWSKMISGCGVGSSSD
jgi:hypothetical protein